MLALLEHHEVAAASDQTRELLFRAETAMRFYTLVMWMAEQPLLPPSPAPTVSNAFAGRFPALPDQRPLLMSGTRVSGEVFSSSGAQCFCMPRSALQTNSTLAKPKPWLG